MCEINVNMKEPLDYEISELVKLINCVDGIRTTSSCFGHNKSPIHIHGIADSIADLNKFKYNYLYNNDMWQIELILTDTTIDDSDWDKIEFVLKTSDLYFNYPVTQLLASNLTMSMKEKLKRNKQSLELSRNLDQEPKWIPVSERLPEFADVYRVTRYYKNNVMNPKYIVDACFFDGSSTWYNDNRRNPERGHAGNVIAWQENPEPYHPESEG